MIIHPLVKGSNLRSVSRRAEIILPSAFALMVIFSSSIHSASENPQPHSSHQELIKKANEFLDQKKYDRAIPLLERAFEISHDENIKVKLAGAYENSASILSKSGLTNEALTLLEKAKHLYDAIKPENSIDDREKDPSFEREVVHAKQFVMSNDSRSADTAMAEARARVLFGQASKSFEQKQYGLSRGFLVEGIQYYDQNPLAFELLGDIEYFSQNLSAAKAAYENSYKLNKADRVAEKLAKLTSEIKSETKLSEYLDEHFIIRYNRKEEFRGSEIREYLRDAYKVISRDFGHYLNFKTVVVLNGKSDYQSIASIPHWSGALFDGKIRIPAYDVEVTKNGLKKLIQHELTHVFVSDISKNYCPVWLQEGLAEFQENKIVPVDLQLYRMAVLSKNLYSAADLEKGIIEEKDEFKVHLFYQQSFVITSALIDEFRMLSIKQLLQKLAKDTPFPEAFREVFRVSFSDYAEKLKQQAELRAKHI